MFPDSARGSLNTKEYPAMYATTRIPLLVKACVELGARKDALSAKLAGAASMLGRRFLQSFSDGNLSAARNILSKMGIRVTAENTGGNHMRTVRLDISADDQTAIGKNYNDF
jgi:chemotaxis protein CheD